MAKKTELKQAQQDVMNEAIAGRDDLVPLSVLWLSASNVRSKHDPESIRTLAGLIEAEGGLLNPLAVVVELVNGAEGYGVVAGGRRLRALQLLVELGKMDADALIPVRVFESEQAVSVSLTENVTQEPMNPADELVAFRTLSQEGKSIEQIAARYGVKEMQVRRRLALANLAPEFVDMYRDGKVSVDVLQALAQAEDHDRQRQAWAALPSHSRSAYYVRNLLSEDDMSASASMVRFVGLKAYKKAGGATREDLFAEKGQGVYITDKVLLRQLFDERVAAAAKALTDTGWKWAEYREGFSIHSLPRDLIRLQPEVQEPTPEQAKALQAIETRRAQIEARMVELEELVPDDEAAAEEFDKLDSEDDELQEKEDAIDTVRRDWTAEQKALSGVVLVLDHQGKLSQHCGVMRKEDRPSDPDAGKAVGVQGPAAGERAEFSKSLMSSLTAHRTAAVAASLARNPKAALVALVHALCMSESSAWLSSPLQLRLTDATHDVRRQAAGYEQSKAAAAMLAAESEVLPDMTGEPAEVFARLLALDESQLVKILALFVGRSYNVISQEAKRANAHGFDAAAAIEQAVSVDMADWWEPTEETYLGAVSKAAMMKAVTEAGTEAADIAGMKKADAITVAQQRLSGRRWLPSPLKAYATEA